MHDGAAKAGIAVGEVIDVGLHFLSVPTPIQFGQECLWKPRQPPVEEAVDGQAGLEALGHTPRNRTFQ